MKNKFSKGYFVVGTDTDIGKTYVSSVLYNSIFQLEKNIFYFKPLQTACSKEEDKLIPLDPKYLCDFNQIELNDDMISYLFELPLSPHLASELEKKEIKTEKILKKWEILKQKYKTGFVEAAGGIYVPIIRNLYYMYDLVKDFDIPVILVTSTKVGTINHTMLTVDFLRSKKIEIQGIIFNDFSGEFFEKDNIKTILEMSEIKKYIILGRDVKLIEKDRILSFLSRID